MPYQREVLVAPQREDYDEIALRYADACATADSARAERLREDMIRAVLPMAERLARRYRGGSEPYADLVQVARVGLVKAVNRYDPERGSFTAYAVNTIRGELKRHFRDHAWAVHVPRRMQEALLELTCLENELTRELHRRPTDAELAGQVGVPADEISRIRSAGSAFRPVSLSTPIGEGDLLLGDTLGNPDGRLEDAADRLTVTELLDYLPSRERRIVHATFYERRTQTEIAAGLGISQMHVSRLLARALSWLRAGLLTDQVPRWPVTGDAPEELFALHTRLPARGELQISVVGEVDRDNADRLRVALLELIRHQPACARVTLELGEVPLLDAAALRVLRSVYEAAQARHVRVTATGASAFLRRLAVIAGLGSMLADNTAEDLSRR
ncbi:RNA polymerase sigma factor rpoD [Actinoplanes sp. SE50]|uniref:sigma-70 family RNA polymerase sigma factor n=1 Tax=unclassified Actinoplanes TaxID=2626549 RepID=UPI00023EC932|nr:MULTISPECIES: sigma-70 family RNA polymerase sigma factor [unclassified Actinoplanes]AEV83156.1 RNA polymerase sigma factor rpoD [Actinoplanes sp. SE50/110]ATO81549.1 RNA polymerase sigma factor rpoD [Actinoplanes sp. SE50]SLL98957.1 RNA polymerase sigma factor RpoD [Actinoplanes sp. SE50/110]